jgi:Uma2 family endonuclease
MAAACAGWNSTDEARAGTLPSMRAVPLEADEAWLEQRARLGHDHLDELWEGVLHVVPPPGLVYQEIGSEVLAFLKPLLRRRGIELLYETGVYRPGSGGSDYRVPDLVFFRSADDSIRSERGIEGGPLAILEIRSPDDETYDKFPFWAALGVKELIVILPTTREVEVYRLAGDRYVAVSADDRGRVHAATIDVRMSRLDAPNPRLRVECGAEVCDV